MKRFLLTIGVLIAFVAVVGGITILTPAGQDGLLRQVTQAAMSVSGPDFDDDTLSVYMCGTSSPLPAPGRAQGCVAVVTSEHFYIVDAGAGSAANLLLDALPMNRLSGVLVTHFHSDHIAAIPDINLNSWVRGRPEPLGIYGPDGVERIVDGFNVAYSMDSSYRTVHHGDELLPPELGVLKAVAFVPGSEIRTGEMTITSIPADHRPIDPAVSYRFDYKGRSVLVTGDTVVTDNLREAAQNVDLLLSDALSLPIVQALETAAAYNGRTRNAAIFHDIQDYHASVADVAQLTRDANVRLTGLYHLVPAPQNIVMERIYQREMTDNSLLTQDRMWFRLPAGTDEIQVVYP